MKLLAGAYVEIDVTKMMWDIMKMIILPIGAGLIFNKLLTGKSKWWIKPCLASFPCLGSALSIMIITAAGRDNPFESVNPCSLLYLFITFSGTCWIYWSAVYFAYAESDCRTIAIEVGMQNAGLASGIAKENRKDRYCWMAAAIFGPAMNITVLH